MDADCPSSLIAGGQTSKAEKGLEPMERCKCLSRFELEGNGGLFSVSSARDVSQSNPVAISKLDKAGITSGVREICIELHLAVLLHSISRTIMLLILPLFVKTTEGWGFDTHAQTAQCYAMHFG